MAYKGKNKKNSNAKAEGVKIKKIVYNQHEMYFGLKFR